MRTDYLGLEAFVAIAELGSFNRAAAYLNISQTALSHRIRKLEDDLGVQIFVRTTREVSMTKVAQGLLPGVRHSLEQLSDAYENLRDLGSEARRHLAFACLPTIAYTILPPILATLAEQFPEITVRLEDRPVARVYEMVQSGEVEFGVSVLGARHWDLEVTEIHTEPYVLFVHRDHPLARNGSVERSELLGLPFAQIRSQSTNRQLVDDALGDYRDQIDIRYLVQNAAMALSLVSENAAVTVLPSLMSDLVWPDLVALPFSDADMTRRIGVVTRAGSGLSPAGEALVALLIETLEQRRHRTARAPKAPPD